MDLKNDVSILPTPGHSSAQATGKSEAAARQRKHGDVPVPDRPGESDGIRKAIREAVRTEAALNRELRIEVERELNLIVVKIVDKDTGEMVRQIPMPEVVENARHVREQMARMSREQRGLVVNQEA